MNIKKAVILVSGGADSATVLSIAKNAGYQLHALSFNYGQKHKAELENAAKLAAINGASHKIIHIDPSLFSTSALASKDILVPKYSSKEQISQDVPVTYVPARNNLFLSYALSYAECNQAFDIFIGVHADDFHNYPDCRPEFIKQFQILANYATATAQPISIHSPLLYLNKTQIIAKGLELGTNYANTISCYDPNEMDESCAHCLACHVRLQAFRENDIVDPIKYRKI